MLSARAVVVAAMLGLVLLAALYLWVAALPMDQAPVMLMPMPGMGLAAALSISTAMWAVMMAGMMLPSVLPLLLLHLKTANAGRAAGRLPLATFAFAGGYLAIWSLFALLAAALQEALRHAGLLDLSLTPQAAWLAAALFLAAGLYEFSPLKRRCLAQCQSPLDFLMTHWRPGIAGGFRMGLAHGLFCLGCCWLLMLLLFAVGVMNLVWVAALAFLVLAEKLAPRTWYLAEAIGALCLSAAVWFLVAAL